MVLEMILIPLLFFIVCKTMQKNIETMQLIPTVASELSYNIHRKNEG